MEKWKQDKTKRLLNHIKRSCSSPSCNWNSEEVNPPKLQREKLYVQIRQDRIKKDSWIASLIQTLILRHNADMIISLDDARRGTAGHANSAIPDGTTLRCRNSIWECKSRVLEWADVELRFSVSSAAFLCNDKDILWWGLNNTTLCHLDRFNNASRWSKCGVDPECHNSVSANTEGWSVLVIVGDCRGRELEQRERERIKKNNTEWVLCLVSCSARGVVVCDDKQKYAVFLPFLVHSQATAQPETLKGQIASRCVPILNLVVHF